MKRILLLVLLVTLSACRLGAPAGVPASATATSPPASPTATVTPPPTNTPPPTATDTPRPSPVPTWEPVAISAVESALTEDGYRRFPFTTGSGLSGFDWIKDNAYEQVTTWQDGSVELQILNDAAPSQRAERMEQKLEVLDVVLPPGFMAQLREAHQEYNQSVGRSVTGEPNQVFPYNDEFQTVWAEYNVTTMDIGNYGIRFSLWWWQSTCPGQYLYCYYGDFPGLEFTGDSSFVFHTILILLPQPEDSSTGST